MKDLIKVILVDDDTDLGNLISMALVADGYKVHFQNSLAGIKNIIEEFKPSMLILDVEIGEEDGITSARDILQIYPSLPVLFISSHTDIDSLSRGVSTGGVGYIRKPFDIQELKVYIDRFAHPKENHSCIQIGRCYSLNVKTRELFYKTTPVKQLSMHEFTALWLFVQNRGNVISYETLSEKVWNKKYSETEASLNNLISRLRKLLENDPDVQILTQKQRGYILVY